MPRLPSVDTPHLAMFIIGHLGGMEAESREAWAVSGGRKAAGIRAPGVGGRRLRGRAARPAGTVRRSGPAATRAARRTGPRPIPQATGWRPVPQGSMRHERSASRRVGEIASGGRILPGLRGIGRGGRARHLALRARSRTRVGSAGTIVVRHDPGSVRWRPGHRRCTRRHETGMLGRSPG